MENLAIAKIKTDGGTQPRSAINLQVVDEYAIDMKNGATFPPVTVFYDGSRYWLADGFHRVAAAKKNDMITIPAEVMQGSKREAVLYSVGVNAAHGLRRTNTDKRRAVETLLRDNEWSKWSDREIARRCAVGNRMVSDLRRSLF